MLPENIQKISFGEIKTFCENYVEGTRVEYKSEIPKDKKNICKTITSMANTWGGFILYGVAADKENGKMTSIDGIDSKGSIKDSIINSCITGIYPPIIPEVTTIKIPETDKVVVVIRVPESSESPHAVDKARKIYIRTGSITDPIDLADIDRIENYLKRKENRIAYKHKLINEIIKHKASRVNQDFEVISITISPSFPFKPLIGSSDLLDFARNQADVKGRSEFTVEGYNPVRHISNGVFSFSYNRASEYFSYRQLNKNGIYYFNETFRFDKETEKIIDFAQIVSQLFDAMYFMHHFYKKTGFYGEIDIKLELYKINNLEMRLRSDFDTFGIKKWNAAEHTISIEEKCFSANILDIELKHFKNILIEVLWSFQSDHKDAIKTVDGYTKYLLKKKLIEIPEK